MIANRKTKTAMIVAIIVLFAVALSTMGVSYAIWTSPDGSIGGGESTASPSVTPEQTYVWAKYFKGNVITVGEKKYAEITTYYDANAGLNLSEVFIPNNIDINGKSYQVYRISNNVFADATLKNQPIAIHIPLNVCEIDAAAFASLPNLETVYFGNANKCTIGAYAFAGCSKLGKVYNVKGGNFEVDATAFVGTGITVTNGTISFAK